MERIVDTTSPRLARPEYLPASSIRAGLLPTLALAAIGFLAIGCRNGVEGFLPYVTAWLVWHLEIEPAAERVFVGPDADFLSDPRLSGADMRQ